MKIIHECKIYSDGGYDAEFECSHAEGEEDLHLTVNHEYGCRVNFCPSCGYEPEKVIKNDDLLCEMCLTPEGSSEVLPYYLTICLQTCASCYEIMDRKLRGLERHLRRSEIKKEDCEGCFQNLRSIGYNTCPRCFSECEDHFVGSGNKCDNHKDKSY